MGLKMAEPTSTTTATFALTGASLFALFPGVDAGVVLGAFAGAAVFVLSSNDISNPRKIAYLCLAFFAGLLAAPMAASLLATVLPDKVQVPSSVGALLAAAIVIKLLIWLIDRAGDPGALLANLRGGGK